MPAAIGVIAAYAAGAITAVQAVIAVVVIAATTLLSNYQKRKAQRSARDVYNASLEDRLVMTATANGARSRVYGRVRNVDGIVFKGTHGPNSQFYVLAPAMAGHEIDGFERVFFNDQVVDLIPDGVPVSGGAEGGQGYWVTTAPYSKDDFQSKTDTLVTSGGTGSVVLPFTPVSGSVSVVNFNGDGNTYIAAPVVVGNTVTVNGVYPPSDTWQVNYQTNNIKRTARIWMYRGAPGQTLYPLLSARFPGLLTAADKFSGMAIIVAELTYDQDAFPLGIPSITAVMRGAKILDTRTGITAWTENPAMIARDWALYKYGGDCTTEDINEESFQAAANSCDVSTVFNTTAGNETRPLYQCGIVCKTDINPDDHFGEMVEAMAGEWGFAGGKLKVVAGVYRAPVAAITDIWLSNKKPVIVTKDPSKQSLVNVFKPLISNADGYIDGVTGPVSSVTYTSTPMPTVRSPTFIAADGQELIRENTLLGVTRNVHAQHICGVKMRDMRDGLTVQMSCNMRAWPLELFDVVTLTLPVFGFSAKQFVVLGWKYTLEDGVELLLKETAPSIFQVNGSLDVLDAAQNTTLPLPWVVEQVTGVVVTSGTAALEDGWPTTRTLVMWNPVVNESIRQSGTIEIQYTLASEVLPAGDWPAVYEQGNATSTTIAGLLANTAYVFRVRAKNTLGVAGKWSVQGLHVVIEPPLIDTPIIEDEAATETASQVSAAGSTSVSNTTIVSATLVNTQSVPVVVQAEWSAEVLSLTPGTNVQVGFKFDNTGDSTTIHGSGSVGSTLIVGCVKVVQKTIVPGGTFQASLITLTALGATLQWANAVVRVTIVKK